MRHFFFALLALAWLASCSDASSRTEIIVAIDTNLRVPEELDNVRVDMVGPSGDLRRSMGPLNDPGALPATVGMVHTVGQPLGPIQVTVVGSVGGMDIVQRRASVSFVEGRTLVLWIHLVQECLNLRCPADQTCAPGGCRPIAVGESELVEWEGSIDRADVGGRMDASMDAMDGGDACIPVAEECNGADDDCDGTADEDFDTATDVMNCGACGTVCSESPPNGSSGCSGGSCTLVCDPGFENCDDDAMTGCESLLSAAATCGGCMTSCEAPTPLCQGDPGSGYSCVSTCMGGLAECGTVCADLDTDPLNCGTCGTACMVGDHAAALCASGSCGMTCDADYDDCDMDPSNGCETSLLEVDDCGACGVLCDLPSGLESCAAGTCMLVGCELGFDDCDGDETNGCETDVASNIMNCGTCGTTCPAAPASSAAVCTMGACSFACDPGFGDCDADATNGCETSLADAATCGTCGISCADPTPVCDGSAGSGFMCVETCAAPSMICGTACTDVITDPLNCGGCGTTCPAAANASPGCVGSACDITCDPGFGDCNTDVSDGCEGDLTTVTDCGMCGAGCTPTNATGVCVAGVCEVATCDMDWLDCDMDPMTGCETDRSGMANCGACGAVCPATAPNASAANCISGTCSLVCDAGFGNCNGDPMDGCEAPLDTVTDCGACGSGCVLANAMTSCTAGTCEIAMCTPGFGDCDMTPGNGCERDLSSTRRHCGMCGNDCGGGNNCCSGVCQSMRCP